MSGSGPRGPADVDALAGLAVDAARAAADLVRDRTGHDVVVAATKSSDTDVVTEVDRAAEALLRSLIRARRPEDAIVGEEGDDLAGTTGVRWIVDPIDGTVNFLYGIPRYAVSVAVEVAGEVAAGVVVDVPARVEYVARPVGGRVVATRNGRPIGVRPPVPPAAMLVATGFSYEPRQRAQQARAVAALLPRVRDIRRLGSCALDVCAVAEGIVDGYVEEGVQLWDHAAAGLVARGSGARTELLPGAGGRPALLCAPRDGFEEFLATVEECGFLGAEPGGDIR